VQDAPIAILVIFLAFENVGPRLSTQGNFVYLVFGLKDRTEI